MVFGNCISKQGNFQVTLQLQENLQLTQSAIAPMANAVFWVKPNADFIYVNDAACCLVGYSREELLSMTMYDIKPDFSPEIWSKHWKTIKKQGSLYFEFLHWTREGQSFPVAITLIYIEYDSREYGCISIRNISKCKQASSGLHRTNEALESRVQELLAELSHGNEQLCREKALRQQMEVELEKSLSLLQATLDSTADAVVAIGCKGDIVSFNQKFVQMWQIPNQVIRSRNHNQCLAFYKNQLKDPETFCRRIQELNNQPDVEGYDTLELKDGRVFERYCQPLRCGEQIIGTVWTFREITKHKQAEKEIRFALEQEKQLAEHRAHFVSMVSHEIRTPLNIISFSTSSLKRYNRNLTKEKKLRYLQRLQTAVEQIDQLMDEVLTLGRAEVGKLKFEPEPLNLIQFCHDILAQLNLSQSRHHTVTFVSEGDCRTVCVDKKLLQPILMNLLSNASEYSPVDSTIDVVLTCQDKKVIFQIKDRGIGIPKAEQQRLFEPFYRAENVGNIPGHGLGLALVKKFVDLHSGQITVASEVGVGTTFTITLPIAEQPRR
ncbi:ATP-binding protein [Scytonema sp. NUACC26]|uniref:sensor histidine kinase n=1 Tax=Scytonema sp. NUACC26 TaxID=3140176 RepID=UPI0034DBDC28